MWSAEGDWSRCGYLETLPRPELRGRRIGSSSEASVFTVRGMAIYKKPDPPKRLPRPVFAFLTISLRLPASSWRPLTDKSRSRSQMPTLPSCFSFGSAALALLCDLYSDSARALLCGSRDEGGISITD